MDSMDLILKEIIDRLAALKPRINSEEMHPQDRLKLLAELDGLKADLETINECNGKISRLFIKYGL